jgi:hypothetical protein
MAEEPKAPSEDFVTSKWRPFMGWTYMAICTFDFIVGPIMNVAFSVITKTPLIPWKSLTLDNGGLFHLSMGAVLGVAAYGRTQEKISKIDAGIPLPGSGMAAMDMSSSTTMTDTSVSVTPIPDPVPVVVAPPPAPVEVPVVVAPPPVATTPSKRKRFS